jgi:hypothetical protein
MPEHSAGLRLLPLCFTPFELDYLNQQPTFKAAVEKMQTLTDFERVSVLGHQLLTQAGHHPTPRPRRN